MTSGTSNNPNISPNKHADTATNTSVNMVQSSENEPDKASLPTVETEQIDMNQNQTVAIDLPEPDDAHEKVTLPEMILQMTC